jgi:hypothetical protein
MDYRWKQDGGSEILENLDEIDIETVDDEDKEGTFRDYPGIKAHVIVDEPTGIDETKKSSLDKEGDI